MIRRLMLAMYASRLTMACQMVVATTEEVMAKITTTVMEEVVDSVGVDRARIGGCLDGGRLPPLFGGLAVGG